MPRLVLLLLKARSSMGSITDLSHIGDHRVMISSSRFVACLDCRSVEKGVKKTLKCKVPECKRDQPYAML